MAIIQATLKSVRDWLIFKMRDNSSYERIPKANYDAAINLAVGEIAHKTGYYERTVGVKTDGTRLVFSLRGNNPEDIANDYDSMMTVAIDGAEIPLAPSADMYRESTRFPNVNRREWTDLLTNNGYNIRDEKLVMGLAPTAATEMIISDENRNFTTLNLVAMADWVAVGGSGQVALGGYSGNAGVYTRDAAPNAMTLTLSSSKITALVIGNFYVLSFWAKYVTTWDGGAITVAMGSYSTTFTPTISWQRVSLRFQADSTAMNIVLSNDSVVLADENHLYLDSFQLSDCILVVTYHAVPQALSADGDTPPAPLNLHQSLLMNKSIETLATLSPVDMTVLRDAFSLSERYFVEFNGAVKLKGQGQMRMVHSNR